MTSDFWDRGSANDDLDLRAFFDSSIGDRLAGLLAVGVLVSLGLTRDRGALGVTVLDNGKKRREYFRRSEDCADWLQLATAALSGNGSGR